MTEAVNHVKAQPNTVITKVLISAVLSFFAALGTVPYGYQFAEMFGIPNPTFLLTFGVIFALCASLANMMLGTYSLLNIKTKKTEKINKNIILVSTLGSVPYGFLCYFGYQNTLPSLANIAISVIVVVVNAGIGYTAIKNLMISYKEMMSTPNKQGGDVAFVRIIGFLIGIAISLVTYLAASSGITDLLIHFNQTTLVQYHLGFILAILSWIPCAALFANANQTVAGELYTNVKDFRTFLKSVNFINILFLLFCLASGTAIAQMTASSFSPEKNIPALFKADIVQFIVQHYLIITALFSSAALNYFSIKKLFPNLGK
jgi:hypothetical protein